MIITLPAIRKGDSLVVLKPLDEVPEDTPLDITVSLSEEREAWLQAGDDHFDSAFGEDEPDYSAP